MKHKLFYLSQSPTGGWVSFTYHLAKTLGESHVLKVKPTTKGGGQFYGDIQYVNVPQQGIQVFDQPIITAVDRAHYHLLTRFKNATLVIHDPTEFSPQVLEFARHNRIITIRQKVHQALLDLGIANTCLTHPFYPYPKCQGTNSTNRALSRVDFDKNTHLICQANRQGAGIEIWGTKNHLYYFHKLKPLHFDEDYLGSYPKDLQAISQLYADTKYLVDLSAIKGDGGGTQYTFLEAEYHGCGLILHRKWTEVEGSLYQDGKNCWAVDTPAELLEALTRPPLQAHNIPHEATQNKWKDLCKS
jgi:hypothetical protein